MSFQNQYMGVPGGRVTCIATVVTNLLYTLVGMQLRKPLASSLTSPAGFSDLGCSKGYWARLNRMYGWVVHCASLVCGLWVTSV